MEINEILKYEEGKDTRDGKALHLYKITKDLEKEDYSKLKSIMKEKGCYYSKFTRSFICNAKLEDAIETQEKKEYFGGQKNVKYGKNLLDYISLEEYRAFLKEYAKTNFKYFWKFRDKELTQDEIIENYEKEILDQMEYSRKYESFGVLDNIREAIIEKSLGLPKEEFRSNGNDKYYLAIWDKLPTIEGLYLDFKKSYTAVWGYDQTNVDIAYQLNTRVWGLDILRGNDGNYYLVRIKDNRFHDKNGVRYFSYDPEPNKTFERDASQTGQYR